MALPRITHDPVTRSHTRPTVLATCCTVALLFVTAVVGSTLTGCGTSASDQLTHVTAPVTTDTLFAQAKRAYDKEDWLDAIRLFDEVRVHAPSSEYATQSTYFEAMARFKQDLFSSAAIDFRTVRRNSPGTPTAARAQYMVGESYYQLSPRPELDQSYTTLALAEFQTLLRDFPDASPALLDSARDRIVSIRSKLSEKFFNSGVLYDKLDDPKSALVYYARVLDQYYDMPLAPEAQVRIAEIQYDRKKLDESRKALDVFDSKYLPKASTEVRARARSLREKLPTE